MTEHARTPAPKSLWKHVELPHPSAGRHLDVDLGGLLAQGSLLGFSWYGMAPQYLTVCDWTDHGWCKAETLNSHSRALFTHLSLYCNSWSWVARKGVEAKWLQLNLPCHLLPTCVTVPDLGNYHKLNYVLNISSLSTSLGLVDPGEMHLLEALLNGCSPLSFLNIQQCLLRAWDSVPFRWLKISNCLKTHFSSCHLKLA